MIFLRDLRVAMPATFALVVFGPLSESVLAAPPIATLKEIHASEDRRALGGGTLAAYLRDGSPEVRAAAARALGRIGSEAGIQPLTVARWASDPPGRP